MTVRPKLIAPLQTFERVSTADAKRRFSELVDRLGEGEHFLVSRRGWMTSSLRSMRLAAAASIARLPISAERRVLFRHRRPQRDYSLRARLESEGEPLAEPDLRIASIALACDLTLITGNVRHFDRVPGLTVENWLEPA